MDVALYHLSAVTVLVYYRHEFAHQVTSLGCITKLAAWHRQHSMVKPVSNKISGTVGLLMIGVVAF